MVFAYGCAETFTCRSDGTWAPYDASCLTGAAADAGAADVAPDVCQGLACGESCCDPSQAVCGLGLGSALATSTGQMVCCNSQENALCGAGSVCCPKQTSQCVNGVCCPNAGVVTTREMLGVLARGQTGGRDSPVVSAFAPRRGRSSRATT